MEKVILVAVNTGSEEECRLLLDELELLAETAGAQTVGRVVQNREMPDPVSYIGKGKLEELSWLLEDTGADGIICDDELSPVQARVLGRELDCKVMDRTLLILDIFAARARSAEGKIQVELAQLQYRLMRLSGQGTALSRLGGGIGTRGPGEKKLETDRRRIRSRIDRLRAGLREVEKHRALTAKNRKEGPAASVALVGYTNAGKTTLLNALTGAEAEAKDQLFATLDPTTRSMKLSDGQEVMVTDTVGFIRKLPHHLVEAFRSTLEEARSADIILHVADASSPELEEQMRTVYETLRDLGIGDGCVITLFNKADLTDRRGHRDPKARRSIDISAGTGEGLEELEEAIREILSERQILITRVYRYDEGARLGLIRKYGRLLSESYEEDGIHIQAYVPPGIYGSV